MDFSLTHMWSQMGTVAKVVVIILVIMSIYAIGVAVERFITFKKGRSQSVGYIGALQGTGASLAGAVGLDDRWRASPIARVIGSGVREFVTGVQGLGPRAADP